MKYQKITKISIEISKKSYIENNYGDSISYLFFNFLRISAMIRKMCSQLKIVHQKNEHAYGKLK